MAKKSNPKKRSRRTAPKKAKKSAGTRAKRKSTAKRKSPSKRTAARSAGGRRGAASKAKAKSKARAKRAKPKPKPKAKAGAKPRTAKSAPRKRAAKPARRAAPPVSRAAKKTRPTASRAKSSAGPRAATGYTGASETEPANWAGNMPPRRRRRRERGLPEGSRSPRGTGSESGGQAGDTEGLSREALAASESVEELVEEGQSFEAGVIDGIENAPDADRGPIRTREVLEDDVPEEYLDEDSLPPGR
jgi:hypothetical protein